MGIFEVLTIGLFHTPQRGDSRVRSPGGISRSRSTIRRCGPR
ncbi:hypothetical protein P9209_12990 [Prescottella defluvii]|nr:hypothetical protein P9209_12990 [Prescottella defluvii]